MSRLAVIAIGRNEGARLVRCLASLGQIRPVIYVDSGSTDGSVAAARAAGAHVVELAPERPFTAARARAEGFAALQALEPVEYVFFVDGDCEVLPGWLEAGMAALDAAPELGLVTGWRAEAHPDASIYNALCDFEWHRPAGPITTCGGDMMVRARAYEAAGGFDPQVIAAEDDEFCLRLGKAGWRLERLPVAMTRHDAAMTRFSQWWRRAVRSGHGFAQVGALHPEFFRPERRRVWIYGLILPLILMAGLLWSGWIVAAVLGLYALSYGRTVEGLIRAGLPPGKALHQGVFLSLSKFPNLVGMFTYYLRKARRADMRIIEYK